MQGLQCARFFCRTGMVKMLESQKTYECMKCKKQFIVRADEEQFNVVPKPTKCPSEGDGAPCDSNKFSLITINVGEVNFIITYYLASSSYYSKSTTIGDVPDGCRDYQEIKIQEQVNKLMIGTIP